MLNTITILASDLQDTFSFFILNVAIGGAILPANQIIPNSLEITDGIIALIAEARALNYF